MTRTQMIESILRLIAPEDPVSFRRWLEKLDNAELEPEFNEVSEAFAPQCSGEGPAITSNPAAGAAR